MKKIIFFYILILLFSINLNAQVGIGTTTPRGALDVPAGANNYGVVLPVVSLTATNVATPVTNPQGGTIVSGTTVINSNTTSGTYGVIPGIYVWDGASWISQFHKYFGIKFTQNADNTFATSASYNNISGLTNVNFTAPYTGTYHFIFSGYLGAGQVNSGLGTKVGFVEGNFQLTIEGINYRKYSHSESFYNSSTGTNYLELFNETNISIDVNLTAGQVCDISAAYNGLADNDIADANPHVIGKSTALGNFCEVNVTYVGR
jgi:hypothetical protein